MVTEKGSGTALADLYRKQGVNLMFEPAKFEDGSRSVEAGIQDILTRMMTYRFKVFDHLTDWLEEFRMYHRKDGLIAKAHDDLMDATRYAVMMLSRATAPKQKTRRLDYTPFLGGASWKTI
jgi:hypothetical protein